ncbi:restriction endonuclease subunit S [Exiguobacterium sp. AM39-5BH]|uniref:restriction endonuclease subunit S n=1 Tax=Exiguobacterium sp. AM39-5BH TaxID=2292355 RepID=UPI000FE1AAE4|nr:restriction endonuclease subunit S [Exiguobacterium sp. AM39-5BH]RHB46637.1 restriction endonuclease subunit S [Exiguobacterium sp. AM39-5BH]
MSNKQWPKKKISWLFDVIGSGTTPSASNGMYYNSPDIAWLNTGDLTDSYIEKTSKYVSQQALDEFSALTVFPKDSLVMAMYGATIGKLGITKYETTTNQACCVLSKPREVITKFIFYWLMGHRTEIINLSQGGGQPNISQGIIRDIKIAVPPVELQNKIVAFIDKEFEETNQLINKKEKMIKLLEQQRQSIITEAVTKGLNPNVKMKDSGVEWIGEIPEHFEKTLIKYISDINMGQSPSSEDVNVLGDGLPFLQGNAEFGEFYPTPKLFSTSINKQSKLNDILLSVRAPVGAMNISNQIFGIGRGLCSITPKIEMKFLWYWLIGYNEYLKSFSTGSTFEAISIDDIKNFVICVPEKNEQLEIVCFLDYKIGQIDNVKKQLKLQIQKLKEYRQSLIYEAVTGKIDVREMEREVSEVSEDGCGYIGEGV